MPPKFTCVLRRYAAFSTVFFFVFCFLFFDVLVIR